MAEERLPEIWGVCYILIGDPTQEDGAGMVYAGKTRGDVAVALNPSVAYARGDQSGRTPLASSGYSTGVVPTPTVPLYPETRAILNKLLPGTKIVTDATSTKSALVFGGPSRIPEEDVPTMVLVPEDQLADGVDAKDAIWLPAAGVVEGGQIVFALPEGDDAGRPMTFQFTGLYREKDQADEPIMKDARCGWIGPPEAVGLEDWSLPNLTQL